MKKITVALLAAVLLGCIFAAGCVTMEQVLTYNGEDSMSLTIKAGEHFTLNAAGNPTTGYEWVVVSAEGLTILDESYTQDAAAPGMTGVGGVYSWHMTAEEPGEYLFVAEYKRPWETEVADRIELAVTATA